MKWQFLMAALVVALVQFAPLPASAHHHWGGCGGWGNSCYHHGWGNGWGRNYGYGNGFGYRPVNYGGYGGYPGYGNYGGYGGYGGYGMMGGMSRFIRGF